MTKKNALPSGAEAGRLIDGRIAEFDDWRGKTLARLRALIRAADPGVVEEWKWAVPVWSRDGIICTGEVYNDKVKLTFPKGAKVEDPKRLFNSSLEGATRRAIDFTAGSTLDEPGLKALIKRAVALNTPSKRR